jgi:hypothetical protein
VLVEASARRNRQDRYLSVMVLVVLVDVVVVVEEGS